MTRTSTLWASAASVVVVAAGASILISRRQTPAAIKVVKHTASSAKPDLPAFITAHATDQNPKVRDIVTGSRLRLAYAQADESWKAPKDHVKTVAAYETARQTFLVAVQSPKGTGEMNPDFGTLTDQAAYQAAVCLVGEGKSEQAKGEFIGFMKARPESPLCKACRDRLVRLNGGKPAPEYDGLLQQDIAVQEKRIRFEYSVCGPKAIEAVLPLLWSPTQGKRAAAVDYKAIAKLCGTTDKGTTIEGMRKGLKSLGVMSYAFQLNAADFDRLQAPIILLRQTHYLLVTKLGGKTGTVYDPTTKRTETLYLPKPGDENFVADVITFTVPTLASN
jgi:hypothetical protein